MSSGDDVFTIAFNVLEQVASENGFAIHNVPYVTRSEKRDHLGFFVEIAFWVWIVSSKSHESKGESPMKKYCS